MKNFSLPVLAILFSLSASSQQTRFNSDPDEKFKEAKAYFQQEKYSLAYPLLRELRQGVRETDKANNAITVQEINYYTIVWDSNKVKGVRRMKHWSILMWRRMMPVCK